MVYTKDEASGFNSHFVDSNDFQYFSYRAKLLGNTVVDGVSGFLRDTAIAMSLQYLSEMPVINWKVEFPANIRLDWRRLEDFFRLCIQ